MAHIIQLGVTTLLDNLKIERDNEDDGVTTVDETVKSGRIRKIKE